MKNTVLSYIIKDANTRIVKINNLHDLYAYGHANEMLYRKGILALRQIDGDSPHRPMDLYDAIITEDVAENGEIKSAIFTMTHTDGRVMKIDVLEDSFEEVLHIKD